MFNRLSPRTAAYLAMLGVVIIWAIGPIVIKPALTLVTPLELMWLRYAVLTILLFPITVVTLLQKRFKTNQLAAFGLVESFNMTSMWLAFSGVALTSALNASLIEDIRPVLVTLASIFFLHEIEERHEWVGLSVSIVGSLIVLLSPFALAGTRESSVYSGTLLLLLSNVYSVIATLGVKKYYGHLPKVALVSVVASIDFILVSLASVANHSIPSLSLLLNPTVLGATLFLAIASTLIVGVLIYASFERIEASEAILFTLLKPVFYIPLTYFLLKETASPWQLFGILILIIGVAIAEHRPGKVSIFTRVNHWRYYRS